MILIPSWLTLIRLMVIGEDAKPMKELETIEDIRAVVYW